MPLLSRNYIKPSPEMKKRFGRLARKRRRELGISQRELGEQLGFTQSRLCFIENGHGVPSFWPLMRMMQLLQIEPADILDGE